MNDWDELRLLIAGACLVVFALFAGLIAVGVIR